MRDNDALTAISDHFGPSFVLVERAHRTSFADAWNDHALRLRAMNAAIRALNSDRITAGKAPNTASKQTRQINNLLLDPLIQD